MEATMSPGKPDEILARVLTDRQLATNEFGHTAMDDFRHFCAYTGCSPVGAETYAWEMAFIAARPT
jgi:hypothetical protein